MIILGFAEESSLFLNLGEKMRPRTLIEARSQKVEELRVDQERQNRAPM